MISELKYLPINWKNGMSFTEGHLNLQYLAIADHIRDIAALSMNKANYGLLGGDYQMKSSFSFKDNITNERVEVSYCRAVTQNGSRIEILGQEWPELNKPLADFESTKNLETSQYWYLLLIVDPFTRIPEGIEDEGESPRRKPNTRARVLLELISLKELELDKLANAIPIAKFENTGSGLRKEESYIPPCMSVNSHDGLTEKYDDYKRHLLNMKKCSLGILAKIRQKRRNKESSHLIEDIDGMCKQYLNFFVSNFDELKYLYPDKSPNHLLAYFAKMARMLNHSMDLAYDSGHMMKYFHQYATDTNASELSKIITNTFEAEYFHFDLAVSLSVVDRFLQTMNEIFTSLEGLDYRELAPRDIVKSDSFLNNVPAQSPTENTRVGIRIKRPTAGESLEDGLID